MSSSTMPSVTAVPSQTCLLHGSFVGSSCPTCVSAARYPASAGRPPAYGIPYFGGFLTPPAPRKNLSGKNHAQHDDTGKVVATGYGWPNDHEWPDGVPTGDLTAYRRSDTELEPVAHYEADGERLLLKVCKRKTERSYCSLPLGHKGRCR